MATAPRIVFPGGIYHVNTHSLDDLPVLGDNVLRERFLCELARLPALRRQGLARSDLAGAVAARSVISLALLVRH
jgi:hypothetical protein